MHRTLCVGICKHTWYIYISALLLQSSFRCAVEGVDKAGFLADKDKRVPDAQAK